MGLITLRPQATALTAPIDGGGTLIGTLCSGFQPVLDLGETLQVAGDGLLTVSISGQDPEIFVVFADDGSVPADTVISSVQFTVRLRTVNGAAQLHYWVAGGFCPRFTSHGASSSLAPLILPVTPDNIPFPNWTVLSTMAQATNPGTGTPWTRADLFHTPNTMDGVWQIVAGSAGPGPLEIDAISLLVQCTTPVSSLQLRMAPVISIHKAAGSLETATIRTATPPVNGQHVTLGKTVPLFDGTIQSWIQAFEGATLETPRSWDCTAVGAVWLLNRRRPFGTWVRVSLSEIVLELISTFAPSFTTSHVQTLLPIVSVVFDGSLTFDACLTQLAAMMPGGAWYIDLARDVHFYEVPVSAAPASVGVGIPAASPVIVSESATALTNRSLWYPGFYVFWVANQHADLTWSAYSLMSNVIALSATKCIQFTVPLGPTGTIRRRVVGASASRQLYPGGASISAMFDLFDNTTTSYLWDSIMIGPGAAAPLPSRTRPGPSTPLLVTQTDVPYSVTPFYAPYVWADPVDAQPDPVFNFSSSTDGNPYVPGVYVFVESFVYADGMESLTGPPSAPITLSGLTRVQLDNVVIGPPLDTDVVFRKIYAWLASGIFDGSLSSWSFLTVWQVIPDNTQTSVTDDVSPLTGGEIYPHEGASTTKVPIPGALVPGAPGPSLETDPPPDPVTLTSRILTDGGTPLTVSVDQSQIRNRVFLKGPDTALTVAALSADTTLTVADPTLFAPLGGLCLLGSQVLGYSAIVGAQLFLLAPLVVPLQVDTFGVALPVQALPIGTTVSVWVQQDDLAAQEALSLVEDDGHGDGIREYRIPDGSYATLAACQLRCAAELALYANPIITLVYPTTDPKVKLGAVVHVDFVPGIVDPTIGDPLICDVADTSNPAAVVADLVIQDLVIDEIGVSADLDARYVVTASSVRFTLDDFLRTLLPA